MSVFRVNGGIINNQTLTGSLRFFKISGPFAWTVSDGTVNLPVKVSGGSITTDSYFVVGEDQPVPNSAAEFALQEVSKQCDIVQIGLIPGLYDLTDEIHIACSASAFGWGSDGLSTAASQMETAIQSLGVKTVYITVGSFDQALPPVTISADLSTVTVVEVPFELA